MMNDRVVEIPIASKSTVSSPSTFHKMWCGSGRAKVGVGVLAKITHAKIAVQNIFHPPPPPPHTHIHNPMKPC